MNFGLIQRFKPEINYKPIHSHVVDECGPDPTYWPEDVWSKIRIKRSCLPKSSESIFVYLNLRGNHWVLLKIDSLLKTGTVYDSNSRTQRGICRFLFDNLVKFLFNGKKWKLECLNPVIQETGNDCGPISMLHLKKLTVHPDLIIRGDAINMTENRKLLTLEILKEKI